MKDIVEKINNLMVSIGREVKLMEVCGTHTVAEQFTIDTRVICKTGYQNIGNTL